jgi:hypothetical protein
VRGAQLYGFLDGTCKEPSSTITVNKDDSKTEQVENPAHAAWIMQDQQVLGFLNASLSREVLDQVAMYTSVAQTWKALNSMFALQSRVRTMQLRSRLSTTRKGEMSTTAYFSKMKGFANEMDSAEKPLEDEDFIAYLLAGLDYDYNSFIENVSARSDPPTISDVYAQYLAVESHLDL